eukprot:1702373-Amphidinium_carterae.1
MTCDDTAVLASLPLAWLNHQWLVLSVVSHLSYTRARHFFAWLCSYHLRGFAPVKTSFIVIIGKLLLHVEWNSCMAVEVTSCPDGSKQNAVPSILAWYRGAHGVSIASEDSSLLEER